MALEPWCGMAPWFGEHMVPGVEVGRAVSLAAAGAGGVWCKAASAGGNSCSKEAGPRDQNRWFKQGLTREEAMFNTTSILLRGKGSLFSLYH